VCVMDKMEDIPLQLYHLVKDNPFLYCLDQIWVHLLFSQIPTGGSKEVGGEYTNAIHFLVP
jgi:hypothetical protein